MSVYDAINILLMTNCEAIKIYNANDYYFDRVQYRFMVDDLEIPLDRQIDKSVLESNVYKMILCCINGLGVIIYEE